MQGKYINKTRISWCPVSTGSQSKRIYFGTLRHIIIIIQKWEDYLLCAVVADLYSPEAAYRSTLFCFFFNYHLGRRPRPPQSFSTSGEQLVAFTDSRRHLADGGKCAWKHSGKDRKSHWGGDTSPLVLNRLRVDVCGIIRDWRLE